MKPLLSGCCTCMVLNYTFCITSKGVLEGIDRALLRVGITVETKEKDDWLKLDGASVMMSKMSGVAATPRERIGDHHITTHCVAHFELAVTDAIKEVPYYTKFDDIVKGAFKFYFYSP